MHHMNASLATPRVKLILPARDLARWSLHRSSHRLLVHGYRPGIDGHTADADAQRHAELRVMGDLLDRGFPIEEVVKIVADEQHGIGAGFRANPGHLAHTLEHLQGRALRVQAVKVEVLAVYDNAAMVRVHPGEARESFDQKIRFAEGSPVEHFLMSLGLRWLDGTCAAAFAQLKGAELTAHVIFDGEEQQGSVRYWIPHVPPSSSDTARYPSSPFLSSLSASLAAISDLGVTFDCAELHRCLDLMGDGLDVLDDPVAEDDVPPVAVAVPPNRSSARDLLEQLRALPREGVRRVRYVLRPCGTWRLIAHDPPLQSLPRKLRSAVVAEAGRVLLYGDWTCCHLLVQAALSGDPNLGADISPGAGFYVAVGTLAGADPAVAGRVGKALLIPLLAHAGAARLAELATKTGLPMDSRAARQLVTSLSQRYPIWGSWRLDPRWEGPEGELQQPLRVGTFLSPRSRRVTFPMDQWEQGNDGRWAPRLPSVLARIGQAFEADAMATVLANIEGRLGALGVRPLLPIHDGLLVDVPLQNALPAVEGLRRLMEDALIKVCPGVHAMAHVDNCGPRWSAAPSTIASSTPPTRRTTP